jgi:hypothetical protein
VEHHHGVGAVLQASRARRSAAGAHRSDPTASEVVTDALDDQEGVNGPVFNLRTSP